MMNTNAFTPVLHFLTETDKKKIYHSALHVIERIGMAVMHDRAAELLKNAGCKTDESGVTRIPSRLVEQAIKSAPANIAIYDRECRHKMDLGGRRSYYGTGSDLIYALDSKTMDQTQCSIDDVGRAARVGDALPNIDFIMSFAHPSEIPAKRAYLESFRTMAEQSAKPIVNTAEGRGDLSKMWEISKILRDGESELKSKPYWVHYAEPISPLKHPFHSLDKLLFCAETGMPVIYSPAPIAGSTAPMTIAGHIVQGLAESLFGLVIHQLESEGAPFLVGVGPAVLDMATGQCSYNAPEYLMAYMGVVETAKYIDLPNWGYAGASDAQIPDGQAAFESGLMTYMSAVIGSNLNHDVGYLDFGRTGSLEMIVVIDEMIGQIRRMQQGILLDEEQIALEVIETAGRTGNYLTHPHTLKHLRPTQWRPRLMYRKGRDKWEKEGRTNLTARARKRLEKILESHTPNPIPPDKARRIKEVTEQYKGS